MALDSFSCRGIIIHENKLMVVKLKPDHDFYCLPGGKLERWETTEQCLKREIKEELGVDADIGELLFIHEGLIKNHNKHLIEFFYKINNTKDFIDIVAENNNGTHSFELAEIKWLDIKEHNFLLLPDFIIPELQNNKTTYPRKIISS